MIKNYFLSFCLLSAMTSVAQITITSADMPNAGDTIRVSTATNTNGVDHTLTGPNYTWDFSTLVPDVQRYEKFDNPLTFPTPYNLMFSAANTSYGKDNYQNTGPIIAGITIDIDYDFFKETSSNYIQVGAGFAFSQIPIPLTYSVPDVIYEFPLDYLATSGSDYSFSTPPISQIPLFYGEEGHRETVVDGWGDITTPYGTFPALRVRADITPTDSIYLDTLGFGIAIPMPARTEYKWLTNGKKVPLLTIEETAGTITNIWYLDSVRAVPLLGVAEEFNDANLSVYPNPASSNLTLQFEIKTADKVEISINNTLGQTQQIVANKNFGEGKHSIAIDINELNLAPGIYFVNLESNGARSVKKIIVTK